VLLRQNHERFSGVGLVDRKGDPEIVGGCGCRYAVGFGYVGESMDERHCGIAPCTRRWDGQDPGLLPDPDRCPVDATVRVCVLGFEGQRKGDPAGWHVEPAHIEPERPLLG